MLLRRQAGQWIAGHGRCKVLGVGKGRAVRDAQRDGVVGRKNLERAALAKDGPDQWNTHCSEQRSQSRGADQQRDY